MMKKMTSGGNNFTVCKVFVFLLCMLLWLFVVVGSNPTVDESFNEGENQTPAPISITMKPSTTNFTVTFTARKLLALGDDDDIHPGIGGNDDVIGSGGDDDAIRPGIGIGIGGDDGVIGIGGGGGDDDDIHPGIGGGDDDGIGIGGGGGDDGIGIGVGGGENNYGTPTDRIGQNIGSCSKDDILLFQGQTTPLPNGIPTYTVQLQNACVAGSCSISDIHVSCGWFSSARLINPSIFRRIAYNDCLVNDGQPLNAGDSLYFQYANTFSYPLAVSSVSCG